MLFTSMEDTMIKRHSHTNKHCRILTVRGLDPEDQPSLTASLRINVIAHIMISKLTINLLASDASPSL